MGASRSTYEVESRLVDVQRVGLTAAEGKGISQHVTVLDPCYCSSRMSFTLQIR